VILLAIALASAGILAYEVLLTRLLAITQWHHFTYMVISIALLGYGVSGAFLALMRDRLKPHFTTAFAASAALFGFSAVAAFAVAQRLPFNALEVIWDPRQLLYLLALYLLYTLPFFCGANCVGLAFICMTDRVGRIYRYDLIGAGTGALGAVAALFLLRPPQVLELVAVLGCAAAALASLSERKARGRRWAALYGAGAILAATAIPPAWIELEISQFKGLRQALAVPGTEVVAERSGPLGLLTAVRSPTIPFRHAPGLSLNATGEPPAQIGVFTDGDGLSAITAFDGRREPLAYLDFTTTALPYHLLDEPRVLVLGAGGGADVLLALYHGARRIDAVELDPNFVWLVREKFSDFAGNLYDRPEVRVRIAEARGFVAGERTRYDMIQLSLIDALSGASARSLSESYLYTVEAFGDFLERLEPGGYLAISRRLKLPPRDSLKLFATALDALKVAGVADPLRHLALIRSWNTTTLLVKRKPLTESEIADIRAFAEARSFDLAFLPGLTEEDANRYNILARPFLFEGARALAGPRRAAFLDAYKFDLRPASDDRPYFFDFFRWRALPELLAKRATGGAAMLDWGYLILFATLVQAVGLVLVLVLLPLWFGRRPARARGGWRVALYFFAIGVAFLFMEIVFIQRFLLFLSHPLYAVAVVLAAFLVFAGLGAGATAWLEDRLIDTRISVLQLAVACIALLAALYVFMLPALFRALAPLADPLKILLSLFLIAPLAFWMGMPFPLALARVKSRLPALVPWAWGVNGCASVLSAILATLLAVNLGFTPVVLIAVALYIGAAALFHAPLDQ
jgi:spermidine synthase